MSNIKTPYDRVFIKTDDEITLPEKQALIGQLEKFLYAICAFDFDDLPIPQSRIEKFVFALISNEIPDIVPQSRAEKFLLAYLTGDTSDLPEPQSRIELLLNNLVFGIQDISNVETIQSRYELLMAYLVQHNEGSNVEPTYHTLTIKYVDVNGNELHERYVEENIKIGTIYNVSHLDDEIEIEDYQYVRTDGDKTTGVMTKDREIIVVYKLKEYDLTIKYQDENGNTIHTSYIETLEKGVSYDVSHLDDEIEIEGYVYLRTDGDSLTGIMDGNKEIIVIYETVVIDIFYNLIIKYVDTNGNEIFNKYEIESIKEGLSYDVSHLDNEIVIDGYKYVKTEGDSLIGIMDENKEITVVYKKLENYNLIIKYQDEDGNTLINDYEEVIQEDNFYDVSHLDDEVLINGYTYLRVTGDSLSGIMDGNKEIIVVYEINYEYIKYVFSKENYTLYNTVEKPVKSAILKGSTKYRDIDTGDILDTFDETKNLELVSVKMPVLTTTGKNLYPYGNIDFTSTNDSWHDSVGTPEMWGDIGSISKARFFLRQGQYVFSANFDTVENFKGFTLNADDETGIFGYTIGNNDKNTFVVPNDMYLTLRIELLNKNTHTFMENIQIEEGLVATEYEPYKSTTVTCDEEVELRGIGDVKDELDLITGEYIQRIGEVVLDGSQTYQQHNTQYFETLVRWVVPNIVTTRPNMTDTTSHFSCDKILTETYSSFNKKEWEFIAIESNGTHIQLVLNADKAKTTEELKTYLSQNPITVQYELATESIKTVDISTVDQDGDNTKLSSFEDITHVTVTSEGILPDVELEVATKNEEVLNTMSLKMDDIYATQNALEETTNVQSENVDSTMIATTEIYEELL